MNRSLVLRLLLLVLPVLASGLFLRVYYTPDEPREASLVVAMAALFSLVLAASMFWRRGC